MGPTRHGSLLLAAAMLGACTPVGGEVYEVARGSDDKRDPRNLWPKQKNGNGLGVCFKRNSGPMTDDDVRASAEQMRRCKPQRPNRSRASKAKKRSK